MNYLSDKIKGYLKYLPHDVKNVFSSKDNLDKIIENEYKKTFEILHKFGIIEYIEKKYEINYKEPKLKILKYKILKNEPSVAGEYSLSKNKIKISKKSIERLIDSQLKFLGYKKRIEEFIDRLLKSLGYKEIKRSTNDIQNIGYLYVAHNPDLIFLYPSYINEKNKIESIAESITRLTTFHEAWHSIDNSILDKLAIDNNILNKLTIDSIIKYKDDLERIDHLLTILDNPELRASAFEVVMYYLANGFHKDERGYIAAYFNILKCGKYIEGINEQEKNKYMKELDPYDLGFCYGNIIVAKYRSSLEENIYNIIDDIIHLDKERAIDVIKHYI